MNKQEILIDRLCNTLFEKVIIFCLIVIEHTYLLELYKARSVAYNYYVKVRFFWEKKNFHWKL